MELPKHVCHIFRQPALAFGQLSAAIIKINEKSAVRNYANRTILNRTIYKAISLCNICSEALKKLNLLKFQGNREKQRTSGITRKSSKMELMVRTDFSVSL
jgi:hypothetical protein